MLTLLRRVGRVMRTGALLLARTTRTVIMPTLTLTLPVGAAVGVPWDGVCIACICSRRLLTIGTRQPHCHLFSGLLPFECHQSLQVLPVQVTSNCCSSTYVAFNGLPFEFIRMVKESTSENDRSLRAWSAIGVRAWSADI